MKTAGKAFTAGFFGWMGAATAIGVTATIAVLIGQRTVKRFISDAERFLRESNEAAFGEEPK